MGNVIITASKNDTWTYALLTPDAVIGDAVRSIVAHLREHELVPVVSRLIALDINRMQEFYGSTRFRILNPGFEDFEFSWTMHDALYGMAPACLIMLSRSSGRACERLLKCKGYTRPEISPPGTIRRMGENVVFNLVHCPDDIASAVRELPILVGSPETERLLRYVLAPPELQLPQVVGVPALLECLPATGGWEAISFPVIANRLRGRLLQWLALKLWTDTDAGLALSDVHSLLTAEREGVRAQMTSAERLVVAMSANARIHSGLAALAERIRDDVVLDAASALSELYDLHGERQPDAIFALADRGIYLSMLEKVIIESHTYAFRPNSEINALY